MEVLTLLVVLAGLFGFVWVSREIHDHSHINYNYSPFNLAMTFAACGIVCGVGIGFLFESGGLNQIVLFSALLCGVVYMYYRAARQTAWWVALYGVVVLLVLAPVLVVLIIFLLLLIFT